MRRVEHIHELVGDTPVVRLNRIVPPGSAAVYAKLESQNPAGSVKDRIARSMIEAAEARGELKEGMTIVEATSGNTGIGLAFIAASKGYKCVLTMPESMTIERRHVLKAYGAKVVLTAKEGGMGAAIAEATKIAEELGTTAWLSRQFDNPDNPPAHRFGTGAEILRQVPELDTFVAGVGTGGTITGAGEVIKAANPEVHIIAVEPSASPVLSGGEKGPHKIQGLAPGFVPSILNTEIYDEVSTVSYDDALAMARRLGREEGILSGISTGAIAKSAIDEAQKLGTGKTVVFIVCDYGERYATHELWASD